MMLNMDEVMAIISKVNEEMNAWTHEAAEGGDESVQRGADEFIKLTNAYTSMICRALQKAEDIKVEGMLDDMAGEVEE